MLLADAGQDVQRDHPRDARHDNSATENERLESGNLEGVAHDGERAEEEDGREDFCNQVHSDAILTTEKQIGRLPRDGQSRL